VRTGSARHATPMSNTSWQVGCQPRPEGRARPDETGACGRSIWSSDAGLLAYEYDRDTESAIEVLNTGGAAAGFRPGSEARWRVALATDDGVRLEGGELRLPPLGGSVLLPDRA
jgi:hypothetical protein